MIDVLYTGDEVLLITTYVKGMNAWTDGVKHDESAHVRSALDELDDVNLTYIPTSEAQREFPADFSDYYVVLYSDIGTDTIIMYEDRFANCPMGKDRLGALRDFVRKGGGLAGIGGWMSFGGMLGMAKWHNTALEEALPVECHPWDDRVEISDGLKPEIVKPNHPVVDGIDWDSAPPLFSGYNEIEKKEDSDLIAEYNGDPFIVTGEYGEGRTLAFASDVAPHWGRGFVDLDGSKVFYKNLVRWLARES